MKFRAFEELAFEFWERIPEAYKEGIDGVRVQRRAKAHAELPDIYTLGECATETYPSDYGGPDTIRSAVVLYWGSFNALADLDPDFDWEEELWETLTHELRHHLESLAAEDALEGVDHAADENFRRHEGESFDPFFYRSGERVTGDDAPRLSGARRPSAAPVEGGRDVALPAAVPSVACWRVETAWFIEVTFQPAAAPSGPLVLEWLGARHAFELLLPEADVTFAQLAGGFRPHEPADARVDEAVLVLVRHRSAWRAALAALRGRAPGIAQIELDVVTERGTGGGQT